MAAGKTTTDPFDATRERIVLAALSHVPSLGWTRAALDAGAADAGLDGHAARRAFPGGALEAIALHSALADRRMLESLARLDLARLRVRERIAQGVRARLDPLSPHREAMRRALARLALPQNAPLGLGCLYRTVDAIWHAAGDNATDFNFYTKRALLAGVYAATIVYWLDDRSEGSQATWRFLDRRIADVMGVPAALGRLRDLARRLPSPLEA
ncbi:MAG: COQ9 family protein, partial [Alphaproteobacteria bacterium]